MPGRTPITVLQMAGWNLWMSFLVVENLENSDQFILGRVMIEFDNGLIRIRNPDRKYVKPPVKRFIAEENKIEIFLRAKSLQPRQAVIAIFRMTKLNSLSSSKQVCLVPHTNSHISVF